MDRSAEFRKRKAQCLGKADLSRKGSVDDGVVELVQLLNSQDQFFTTSSCAGRILLLDGGINGFAVQKQNCCWLLVTHKPCIKEDVVSFYIYKKTNILTTGPISSIMKNGETIEIVKGFILLGFIINSNGSSSQDISRHIALGRSAEDLFQVLKSKDVSLKTKIVALKKASGDAVLKFEPFVLHVQCQQLQDAQFLHSAAIECGFRNSGITVGKRGKTMLAVRSTHSLEVPLSHKGKLMVTEEYIDFLLNIANHKMEENSKRIERFYNCLRHALERETVPNSHPKIKEKSNPSYTHKKKRNPEKAHGKCITEENNKEPESDDDDPGISVNIFPQDY